MTADADVRETFDATPLRDVSYFDAELVVSLMQLAEAKRAETTSRPMTDRELRDLSQDLAMVLFLRMIGVM